MKAGTFDGGYTLEPSASIMHNLGIAKTIEAGVIAKYILGSPDADAYAAGCAFTTDFIKSRPDVAKRFAQAWAKAIDYISANPDAARKYLAKNTLTPDNVVDIVPMLGYTMTKDMIAEAAAVSADVCRFRPADRRRAGKNRRQAGPAIVLTLASQR